MLAELFEGRTWLVERLAETQNARRADDVIATLSEAGEDRGLERAPGDRCETTPTTAAEHEANPAVLTELAYQNQEFPFSSPGAEAGDPRCSASAPATPATRSWTGLRELVAIAKEWTRT